MIMMNPDEPQVTDNGRYSVMETCRALGINRSTLRRWVNAGKIQCKFRKIDNRKVFEGREIKKAWRIAL